MKDEFYFYIDVVGSCNLRCPSCPQGNFGQAANPRGFMSPGLLENILDKAYSECDVTGVALFNWTEPFLHPKLPAMIETVKSRGCPCDLSSNLNVSADFEAILASDPDSLRISVSGFSPEVYSRTHRGGNVARVLANMERLADSKARTGAQTRIEVYYHRYLGNLDDEVLMRQHVASLGFEFKPGWAVMMPLEKVLAFTLKDDSNTPFTSEDIQVTQSLALPLDAALAACTPYRRRPCRLREGQMVLDCQGNAMLCCAAFDSRHVSLGPYLSTGLRQLQKRKASHPMCARCMSEGIHVYSVLGAPGLDEVAANNVVRHYSRTGIQFLRPQNDGIGRRSLRRAVGLVESYAPKIPGLRRFKRKFPGLIDAVRKLLAE